MSLEIYSRSDVREAQIWIQPKVDVLTALGVGVSIPYLTFVIPLERTRYLQDFYIVQEHETIRYDQMIAQLVAELAKINGERTVLLADLATKRVEENLKIEARKKKLDNKAFSNLVATELMDAQFDALRHDQAQYLTKLQIVETARIKTAAEIQEIQSKILLEGGNLLLAEIDTLKAQQDLAKKDIEMLDAELKITRLALEVIETLLAITNTNLEGINTRADISMIKADLKRTELSAKHLTAEQKEIAVELDSITRRLASDLSQIYARETIVQQESSDASSYLGMMASLLAAQLMAEAMRGSIASLESSNGITNAQARVGSIATPEAQSRISEAALKQATSINIANLHTQVGYARRLASQTENDAHITAATTRAKASVASVLQHVIGTA